MQSRKWNVGALSRLWPRRRSIAGLIPAVLCAAALGGCGGEAGLYSSALADSNTVKPPAETPDANWAAHGDVAVTSQLSVLEVSAKDPFNGRLNTGALGGGTINLGYEYTTPADRPLEFTITARSPGNEGAVSITLVHAMAGGAAPVGGIETIFMEGLDVEAPALELIPGGALVTGDGLARIAIRGSVWRQNDFLFRCESSAGVDLIAFRVALGPFSEISLGVMSTSTVPLKSETVVYSSNEQGFGLPAIGVSGDRYSLVAYEGSAAARSRRWLQMDAQSGTVTGGLNLYAGDDVGGWRDQEIAAKDNVLAVAHTGNAAVQLEISLDRGASFGISQTLVEGAANAGGQRLVQVAISPTYRIAVAYWRTSYDWANPWIVTCETHLVLSEHTPTAFDTNGTPTGYSTGTQTVLVARNDWVTPFVMGLEYSAADDLVLGYAYSYWVANSTFTEFRCATRLGTGGSFTDTLVDSETNVWPEDPSVALLGSGPTMRILYVYERADGIHLRQSQDGGQTFSWVTQVGGPGANMPSIHARVQNGQTRVDLLWLQPYAGGIGSHLCIARWDNFSNVMMSAQGQLYVAHELAIGTRPFNVPARTVNSVAWMGYDSVTVGDDVAVVVHVHSMDVYAAWGGPTTGGFMGAPAPQAPPVLLPGMTGPVPPANLNDVHKLHVMILD